MHRGFLNCQGCARKLQDGMDIFMHSDAWYCSESCRRHRHSRALVVLPADSPVPVDSPTSPAERRAPMPYIPTLAYFAIAAGLEEVRE
mmetsp:Transcript_92529/g.258675  ORF Transcript_92529/g.258675 Transcript_92529/m.258675 type:complete len:88 (+) Transcript_92529:66-329(+)